MENQIDCLDLLDVDLLQRIQDQFAQLTDLGSLIYDLSGNPITKPSNFCEFCTLVRSTEKGRQKCMESDAVLWNIAKNKKEGAAVLCTSGRLWDGVAPIIVNGQQIASWGIGQVLFEEPNEEIIRSYAGEIGIDGDTLLKASKNIRRMSKNRFEKVIQFLIALSSELSEMALFNVRLKKEIVSRKKSEEQYSAIVKNAIVGICEMSRKGKLEYVNGQFAKMLGYNVDELINRSFFEICHSKYSLERHLSGMVDFANPKYASIGYDVKAHIKRKNGKLLPCRICLTPQRSLSGDIMKISGVIMDISSEEKVLERLELQNQALIEKQKQVTMFFDNSITALCIYDKDLKRIRWNPAYRKFMHDNLNEDVANNNKISEPIKREILREIFSGKRRSYETKREFGYNIDSFQVAPIRDYENRIHQLLVSIEDVTDYQLMIEKALFSEKMAGVGLLASGIAHDIKGVFAILGNSNYGLRKLNPEGASEYFNEQYKKILSNQEEGLKYAKSLLNNLFTLSGKTPSLIDYFNVKQSIESIVSIYSGGILRKNAHVSVSCDKDLVLKCDKYLFNQVVMNLLSNAVDAVSSNGRIEIKVSTDKNKITILFSDNGHGIKNDCIDKIFKAFYTEKENGTGLGLFSVKRIVESLKGNITVESEAGKGSMFILNLDKNDSIYFKNDLKDGI